MEHSSTYMYAQLPVYEYQVFSPDNVSFCDPPPLQHRPVPYGPGSVRYSRVGTDLLAKSREAPRRTATTQFVPTAGAEQTTRYITNPTAGMPLIAMSVV